MERMLVRVLRWKTLPATVYTWMAFLIAMWDSYADFHWGHGQVEAVEHVIRFKKADQSSYRRFRDLV
jgi:hypothetical protein